MFNVKTYNKISSNGLSMLDSRYTVGDDVAAPDGAIVRNITLFAVLVYEMVGPYLTKQALTKAGEIKAEGRKSARDEHIAKKKAESAAE